MHIIIWLVFHHDLVTFILILPLTLLVAIGLNLTTANHDIRQLFINNSLVLRHGRRRRATLLLQILSVLPLSHTTPLAVLIILLLTISKRVVVLLILIILKHLLMALTL